jgi:Ca2+-binding RTX toxin-like protein
MRALVSSCVPFVLLLAGAQPAAAAQTFGSDLTLAPDSGPACDMAGPCTSALESVRSGGAHPAKAPASGVVVRFRAVTGIDATITFRLVRFSSSESGRGVGTGPQVFVAAGGVRTFDARLPIQAGDAVAYDGEIALYSVTEGASHYVRWQPPLDETDRPRSTQDTREVLLNADVEPDADADGFGDESQDNCPTAANPGQENLDADAQGDACDADDDNDTLTDADEATRGTDPRRQDTDGDGIRDDVDNCGTVPNSDQADRDGDGIGAACDTQDLAPGRCANLQRGTAAPDRLAGTALGDNLLGLGGKDRLTGGPGDDCLKGGPGNDRLSGGGGRDVLGGNAGKDRLVGGAGTNTLSGGAGRDRIVAVNRRRDRVRCGAGRDTVRADRADRLRDCERVRRPRP